MTPSNESERAAFESWCLAERPAGCITDMERGWLARASRDAAKQGEACSDAWRLRDVIAKYGRKEKLSADECGAMLIVREALAEAGALATPPAAPETTQAALIRRAMGHPRVLEIMADCASAVDTENSAQHDSSVDGPYDGTRWVEAAKRLRATAAAIRAEDPELWEPEPTQEPGADFKQGYEEGLNDALRCGLSWARSYFTKAAAAPQAQPSGLSVKRSEWESLSPEARAKLEQITGAGSREEALTRAQAAQDMRDKPLLAQAQPAPVEVQYLEEACPVCGGRPSACAVLGHRPAGDRKEWRTPIAAPPRPAPAEPREYSDEWLLTRAAESAAILAPLPPSLRGECDGIAAPPQPAKGAEPAGREDQAIYDSIATNYHREKSEMDRINDAYRLGREDERAARPPAPISNALRDCCERMERARRILTDDNPRPDCNWGMLDTTAARVLLSLLKDPTP